MDVFEQLGVLQAAHGHPAKLALATVDLAYPALADSERRAIREALEAAAIGHWCDGAILASLLEISEQESGARLVRLRGLSIVEPFPARGKNVANVHEASRLAIRKWMAKEESDLFRKLSARAATFFEGDTTPSGRIEWIYHLLSADPELGADELEKFDREWSNQARPAERYAFATALKELEDTQLVTGRARVWVLLAMAWARAARSDLILAGTVATEATALARTAGDDRAEGDAQLLLGTALTAEGNLTGAHLAYARSLEISRGLAERDPRNLGWQWELAVAHRSVAGVLREQGALPLAEEEYGKALLIVRRLVAENPAYPLWQGALSAILIDVGDMLQLRGQLSEAEAAFVEALAIREGLATQDPTNGNLQLELALGYSRVGDVLQAQGKVEEAKAAFVTAMAISQRLAATDPTHAGWQMRLSVAHNRLGDLLQAQGKLLEAQGEFEKSLAIDRPLVEKNPTNAGWQRELAVGLTRVADVLQAQGKGSEAQTMLAESLEIHRNLVKRDPTSVEWQHDLAMACLQSARLLCQSGDGGAALPLYDEAIQILGVLIEAHGQNGLRVELDVVVEERAKCLPTSATRNGNG
jgi:tetratricopeptide (TPR) repeat protein